MKLELKKQRILHFLFYMLLVSVLFGYLGYYLYCKNYNINIYMLYSNFDSKLAGVDFFSRILRFMKDIIIVILFIVSMLCIRKKKHVKIILATLVLYLYGTILTIFNGYGIGTALMGVRTYLYFITLILFFEVLYDQCLSLRIIMYIITLGCIINLIVAFEQANRGTYKNIAFIGSGNYRFPALFGGTNGLSSFAISVALMIFVLDNKIILNKLYVISIYIITILMTIASGTRSGMINIMLIIYVWTIVRINIKSLQKVLITVIFGIFIIPLIINIVSNIAGRGNIMQVQLESGRLKILMNILTKTSLVQLIFGRGIGVGSNSDVLLRQSTGTSSGSILDGTFNVVLYQYGIIGLVLLIIVIIIIYKKISHKSDVLSQYLFLGTMILQCFTGNIFETYAFLILMFVCYQMIADERTIHLELNVKLRKMENREQVE